MVRYDFRHGPRVATKPRTDHHTNDRLFWNKFKNAGPIGWCMTCEFRDVPATTEAVWQDPKTGERYDIVVCDACAKHCQDVVNVT